MNLTFPPGPPNDRFGQAHSAAMRNNPAAFGMDLQRRFGDVVFFRLGPISCYQFAHPDAIHDVLSAKAMCFGKPPRLKQVFGRFEGDGLIVSDGDHWSCQRRLIQPAFHSQLLAAYAECFGRIAEDAISSWQGKGEIDVASEMRSLALRIILNTLFSTTKASDVERIRFAVGPIQQWAMREFYRVVATPRWLPLIWQSEARRAIADLDSFVRGIVESRLAEKAPVADDLLSRVLSAVDPRTGKRMTKREVRDEMVTMLLAGHETMASALTWTLWLLATHNDHQKRLAEEIQNHLRGQTPKAENFEQLASVQQAFKESMRLYPPVYLLSRWVVNPVEVAGFRLLPGSQVFLNVFVTHRDARWYPDPERFDPSRFACSHSGRMLPSMWFPFGAGPRGCIGKDFSIMEGTMVLSALLQRYQFTPAEGQVTPEFQWGLSLQPRGGLRLSLSERK